MGVSISSILKQGSKSVNNVSTKIPFPLSATNISFSSPYRAVEKKIRNESSNRRSLTIRLSNFLSPFSETVTIEYFHSSKHQHLKACVFTAV